MRFLYLVTLLFYFSACSSDEPVSPPTDQTNDPSDTIKPLVQNTPVKYIEQKIEKTDTDFLCDCDSLSVWLGGIQGVTSSDSTGIYCMAQCCTNLHFDVVLFSKKPLEWPDYSAWKNEKNEHIKDNLPGVEYYAFEIPKTTVVEPENEFDIYDYVYPSEVKVYKKFDDGWYLVRKQTVRNFEELGRLKINAIYQQ